MLTHTEIKTFSIVIMKNQLVNLELDFVPMGISNKCLILIYMHYYILLDFFGGNFKIFLSKASLILVVIDLLETFRIMVFGIKFCRNFLSKIAYHILSEK